LLRSHLENERLVLDEVQLEGEKPTSFKNLGALCGVGVKKINEQNQENGN